MQYFPVANPRCSCEADATWETAIQHVRRGRPIPGRRNSLLRHAKQIHHARKRDGALFWHWSDVEVTEPPEF